MKFAKDHDYPEDAVLMQKVNVNGKNADENWKLLKAAFNNKDVFWNFEKFLVDKNCLLYTSPSPRDLSTSRMPSSA